jgi:hypothetical protein
MTLTTQRWLLLIHQIPPKPDYLRVKIGRRLQRVGAIAIKNSVYALPLTPDALEDFSWIAREIEEGHGEAFISEASLVGHGLTDDALRARFNDARAAEYREILTDARRLLKRAGKPGRSRGRSVRDAAAPAAAASADGERRSLEQEIAKLRRRYEAVNAIDFFNAAPRTALAGVLHELEQAVHRLHAHAPAEQAPRSIDGATWVTRRDVRVDRIASAWLIRRFIDRRPRFIFVDAKRYVHTPGELRFDMFDAEYTHTGDACTFETLVGGFVSHDAALREIAEIVHDVDCKDGKFRREEAGGLARMIAGIAKLAASDEERLKRGAMLFDELYAAFDEARR